VIDVPANELTQKPLSRLTPWERRSSHVPLTAPGVVVTARAEDNKTTQGAISLPERCEKKSDVSNITFACRHRCHTSHRSIFKFSSALETNVRSVVSAVF
jgi:hypothetical protein